MITPQTDFDWYAIAGGIRGPDFHIWSGPVRSDARGIKEHLKYIFTARIRHLCGVRSQMMCSVRGPLSDANYDIKKIMSFLDNYKEYSFDTEAAAHYMFHVSSALKAIDRAKPLNIMDTKLLCASNWLYEFFFVPTSVTSRNAWRELEIML